MPLPVPEPGLVISYAYLWHYEQSAGAEEGRKHRPCVIVLAVQRLDDQTTVVTVLPITHRLPANPSEAVELPLRVKRHLGLDDERSWVMLHEGNEFIWPGYDLRTLPQSRDRYDYGLLPPRLFELIVTRFHALWAAGQGRTVPRD